MWVWKQMKKENVKKSKRSGGFECVQVLHCAAAALFADSFHARAFATAMLLDYTTFS